MNSENKTESVPNDTTTTTAQPSAKSVCCGIYGLRNKTNDKWYIGQSWDIEDRWKRYRRLECRGQRKLYQALKKYGYDNFDKTVLESCSSQDELDRRETFWIEARNSVKNGYNISCGGSGGKLNTETINRISRKLKGRNTWSKGRVLSDIHKQRISQSRLGSKNPMWGKHLTNDHKQKLALTRGRKRSIPGRLDGGIYIFQNMSTNEIFIGTRYEFMKKSVITSRIVFNLVHNKSHTTIRCDWKIIP